jgi:DNA-binding HxlR family transcriptional regulator
MVQSENVAPSSTADDGAVARQEGGQHEAALELPEHLARELEVLAKRWTLQLLFLLLQRPARFSELERAVPGLTNRVMSDRLRELRAAGLVNRQVDPGPPIASIYALTADGGALRPILEPLLPWADRRDRRAGSKPPAGHVRTPG